MIAIIAAVPAGLAAVGAIFGIKNHNAVQEIKISVDGRMDQLLAAMNAQGRQEQREETRTDTKIDPPQLKCKYPV
jgi:hypothetical protein